MLPKAKLNLNRLKVESFVTEVSDEMSSRVKGGIYTLWYQNGCTTSDHELCIPETEWTC